MILPIIPCCYILDLVSYDRIAVQRADTGLHNHGGVAGRESQGFNHALAVGDITHWHNLTT